MRLENSFEVAAPVEDAWRLLDDVPGVVPCMPGAELVEVVDSNRWKAKLRVKLGPIALQFDVDVRREEAHAEARRVVLAATAREPRGRGGAEATLTSTLAAADSGTRVNLVTDLALRGAVAQYGRGVVADVAARLTEQFAACIERRLSESSRPEPGSSSGTSSAITGWGPSPAKQETAAPVTGLRLLLGAVWRSLVARMRRNAS
jgi:carbon monoxide dehydrogenase subunit G